ncbi:MAG: hypothetical protein ACTSU5_03690 [Promethearchaeota archaeon]
MGDGPAGEVSTTLDRITEHWTDWSLVPRLCKVLDVPEPESAAGRKNVLKLGLLLLYNAALVVASVDRRGGRRGGRGSSGRGDGIARARFLAAVGRAQTRSTGGEGSRRNLLLETAGEILQLMPGFGESEVAVRSVVALVTKHLDDPSGYERDVVGRLYHGLFNQVELKHLSSFYTKPVFAAVLAGVAVNLPGGNSGGSEPSSPFRVCDFSCGSGTLLTAVYRALRERERARAGDGFDPVEFHREFLEESCYAFDAMKFAVLMTTGTLLTLEGGADPRGARVELVGLSAAPPVKLGSLNFLTGVPGETLPLFDLQVLNPPYARSCGDNLQFGTLSHEGRAVLNRELRRIRAELGRGVSGQAGQAADFLQLAAMYTRPGGRVALVVPKTTCFGPSWAPTREFLSNEFRLEVVAFNNQNPDYAFSEHTHFSECLVVARKAPPVDGDEVLVVQFTRDPVSTVEADRVAQFLVEVSLAGDTRSGHLPGSGGGPLGTFRKVPQQRLAKYASNWAWVLGFFSPEISDMVYNLRATGSTGPLAGQPGFSVPLVPLKELGEIGYDRSQVTRALRKPGGVSDNRPSGGSGAGETKVRVYWGRNNAAVSTVLVDPTDTRELALPGRNRESLNKLKRSASHLLVPETLFLTTTRVFWLYCSEPVLSNVFWTFTPFSGLKTRDGHPILPREVEKVLASWGNATLGILLFLGARQETRGAWVHWKKGPLKELPVLDPRELTRGQVDALLRVFEEWAERELHESHVEQILSGEKEELDARVLEVILPGTSPRAVRDLLAFFREATRESRDARGGRADGLI